MILPEPTRTAGLLRLRNFAPFAGRAYAEGRNTDLGPDRPTAVSALSPYVRHRLVTEAEVVAAAQAEAGPEASTSFVQEVFWRTYWKGWLELRPGIWQRYCDDLAAAAALLVADPTLRVRYLEAVEGRTGLEPFDAWVAELRERHWLHNHARMWFASIWCFTLQLPWQLGADLFLRELLDGDAAVNTLSWRWVAGIQTRGKHYVARADNIARYTGGRFHLAGQLDEMPEPIVEAEPGPPLPLQAADAPSAGPVALLLHDDDLGVESLPLVGADIRVVAGLTVPEDRSPQGCAAEVAAWTRAALADGIDRAAAQFGVTAELVAPAALASWAAGQGVVAVVTPWAPTGWTASRLAALQQDLAAWGLPLLRVRRPWDSACWPLATKGFFAFRPAIQRLARDLLSDQPPM